MVSRNHGAFWPRPLTRSEEIPSKNPTFPEIRRLIVRFLVDDFGLRANRLSGGTITPLKCCGRSIRYDHVPLTKHSPNRLEGVVCYGVKSLDRLGVGMDGGGVAHKLQSTRSDALLASVISDPLFPHRILSSAWNGSKTRFETYPIASRMRVTRGTTRMPSCV